MSTSGLSKLRPILMPATVKHTASLIFLHGSGDTGDGIRSWLNMALNGVFSFPHIRIIYPTAPLMPYTPSGGQLTRVWFDRKQISPFCSEDVDTLDNMCIAVKEIVDNEVAQGIPYNRIIIGGFSMGGALAFHLGYRFCRDVAGVFALSGFLNENSVVYQTIQQKSGPLPPLFQTHGGKDPLVLTEWGQTTNRTLSDLGVKSRYKLCPNLYHEFDKEVIDDLKDWILQLLPVEQTD